MASFDCACGYTKEVKDELIGKKAKCPKCGSVTPVKKDEPEAEAGEGFDLTGVLEEATRYPPRLPHGDSSYDGEDSYGSLPGRSSAGRSPAAVMAMPEGASAFAPLKDVAQRSILIVVLQCLSGLLLLTCAFQLSSADRHLQSGKNDVAEIKQFLLAQKGADRVDWEYKIVAPSDTMLDLELGTLGRGGWEVVTARRATGPGDSAAYEMILKRRRKKD